MQVEHLKLNRGDVNAKCVNKREQKGKQLRVCLMNTFTFTLPIICIEKAAIQFIQSPCFFLADGGGCVITVENLGGRAFLYSNKTKQMNFGAFMFFSHASS